VQDEIAIGDVDQQFLLAAGAGRTRERMLDEGVERQLSHAIEGDRRRDIGRGS